METRQRTVIKAVLWTVLGMVIMALVGLILTGSLATGGAMAAINAILGFVSYFLYERVWSRVRWGRV